jgi:DNA-binding NarL/FixJ family response regulator
VFHLLSSQSLWLYDVSELMLTKRETQVATLAAQGKSNKQIAFELGLAYGTIKIYMFNLFRKTGVSNRTELSLYWVEQNKRKEEA